jgi:hypothetical protein
MATLGTLQGHAGVRDRLAFRIDDLAADGAEAGG